MNRKQDASGLEALRFFPGGVALISKDREERVFFVNDKLCELYQCTSKEEFFAFTGGTYHGLLNLDDYVPLQELYKRRFQKSGDNPWLYHVLIQTKQEDFRRLTLLLSEEEDSPYGPVWVLHVLRSSIREDSVEVDPVTGLMGRYAFYQKALAMAERDQEENTFGRYVPVYINLTNFKLYNANHGLEAGDELLRELARCLVRHFPSTLIAHLTADNFVLLAARDGLEEKLLALAEDFRGLNDDSSVSLKAGVNLLDDDFLEGQVGPKNQRRSFDAAKIAADSIKRDASRVYAIYAKDMGRRIEEEAYILRNFEQALQKGFIKIYCQPVVRTLTGRLCNVEALARWEDPERGLLSPGQFIPVLEESRLITKLDFYVIEQVAKLLRFQMENQRPLLPISVNLSRVDFDSLDPVEEVEKIVARYHLPRYLLRIEITETALAMNSTKLRLAIQRFRKAGYECWLDDFGSGYSSLNTLQHFHFDEIKLDMSFQRNFNEESRKILKALVLMAKNLGIHTLAEGVETKEQADFLTAIGCEKIQGYYYAKPMPYETCHQFCYEKNLVSENMTEAAAMEKAGLVNVMTDTPVAVFCYDGQRQASGLWENRAFRRAVQSVSSTRASKTGHTIDLWSTPAARQFKELLDRSVQTGKEESLTFVDNGQYMKVSVQIVSGAPGLYMGRAELYNITFDSSVRNTRRLDKVSKYLLQVYDGFYLYHGRQDEVEVIGSLHATGMTGKVISRRQWMTIEEYIHPDDRQRFLSWAAPRTLYRQAKKSGRGLAVGMFRVRREDGNFYWQEFDALAIEQGSDSDILFCIKDAPMERIRDREAVLPVFLHCFGVETELPEGAPALSEMAAFQAIKNSLNIKFFWKDTERRFVGASRAFLDYYDIHDEKAILGKTDEDMGWHVDAEPYKEIEEKVLQKGISSYQAVGKCIIRGRLHNIRATKVPLYEGNRIVGLMGYFEDLDQEERVHEKDLVYDVIDKGTGLTGFRGLVMAGLEFYSNYERRQEEFIAVFFHIPNLNETARLYGDEIYEALQHKISRIFTQFRTPDEVFGYLGNGRYLLFLKYKREARLEERLLKLANQVHGIREVHGHAVTLYLQWASAYGSETGSLNALLKLLYERLEEAEQQQYGQSIYVGDRIAIDRVAFDSSDQLVMMSRLEDDSLIYVNKAGLRNLGLPEDYDYRGMTCYKLLCGLDTPCPDCPKSMLRRDHFYTRTYHNRHLSKNYLIQHILVPWHGRNCHLEIATDLHHYMKDEIEKNDMLFKEMAVNDAIEIGMREENPSKGIQNMLARIGEILECEKVGIAEEMPDGTICNTYEWCREGIPSTKADLQHIAREDVQYIYDSFDTNQIAIIEDVPKVVRKYGRKRPLMKGIKNFISGHLIFAGRSLGYTEVVNPSTRVMQEASPLLATLTRFLAILLHNRDTMVRLNRMGYVDVMTGIENRRGFLKCVQNLPAGHKTAFIFGDMNGLKYINDHYGHKAGDKAIRTASKIIREMAGEGHVFRMGGDEFLMVIRDMDKEQANDFILRIKAKFCTAHISMAFGAAMETTPIGNVDTIITQADAEMYKDKKHPRKS